MRVKREISFDFLAKTLVAHIAFTPRLANIDLFALEALKLFLAKSICAAHVALARNNFKLF